MSQKAAIHTGWTMDSASSRDLDDALRFEPREQGGWSVHIYVAAPGLEFDGEHGTFLEAVQRRSTRYLPEERTIPMLGEQIEQGYSLLPGQERDALHIRCEIDEQGSLLTGQTCVERVRFRSAERFVYADPFEHPERFALERAFALQRIMARRLRGSPSFVDLERGIYTDEHGQVHELVRREEVVGHLIVQESMILANEALATWCAERGVRVIYRVHTGPRSEDPAEQEALDAFVKRAIVEQDGAKLDLLEATLSNNMAQATYSSQPAPHWALQLPMYMHGTSPLRRAHDLIAQMQIFAYLEHEPLPIEWHRIDRLIEQMSEAQAKEDARTTARYKRRDEALFLEQLLGDEALSSKQIRRAIRYILRDPSQHDLQKNVLERVARVLDEAKNHPSHTVPVALLDVMLESKWPEGRALATRFLDAHESGWKQVRAHATALRPGQAWWSFYGLEEDPVLREELAVAAEREEQESLERARLERARRDKRRALDPLARFNDLKNRGLVRGEPVFESTQADGQNVWHGTLEVELVERARSRTFTHSAGSKKGVKRELITTMIAWRDALEDAILEEE